MNTVSSVTGTVSETEHGLAHATSRHSLVLKGSRLTIFEDLTSFDNLWCHEACTTRKVEIEACMLAGKPLPEPTMASKAQLLGRGRWLKSR